MLNSFFAMLNSFFTYTFICIICVYIPNNGLSFVIYMKLVQSMGSQRTRQLELPLPTL